MIDFVINAGFFAFGAIILIILAGFAYLMMAMLLVFIKEYFSAIVISIASIAGIAFVVIQAGQL